MIHADKNRKTVIQYKIYIRYSVVHNNCVSLNINMGIRVVNKYLLYLILCTIFLPDDIHQSD